MDLQKIINTNVKSSHLLLPPKELHELFPSTLKGYQTVLEGREIICNILDRKDPRLFVVIGPCSIHDTKAALEYAARLKEISEKVKDQLYLVMRVYFEKPRTTVGWKGLINDPYMNGSFQIEEGLKAARKLLIDLTEMGLPTATEALDLITPQYLSDLICWAAIGARTTESQSHREMASGLSTPVGFKNGTDGNIQVAVDAIQAALSPHHFLGIDPEGRNAVFWTRGNRYCHVVLRGGQKTKNYDSESIQQAVELLKKGNLRTSVMVDCSHGNSNKDFRNQPKVFEECIDQVLNGNTSIAGMMVESHLFEGNQSIPKDLSELKYGVSVTDQCISWETTEKLLLDAAEKLRSRK